MRRLLAALLAIAVLHLTVAGRDLACASHEGAMRGMATPAPASGGMTMGGAHTAMAPAATHTPAAHAAPAHDAYGPSECAPPVQTGCCDAMSSCGVTVAVGAAMQLVDAEVVLPAARAEPATLLAALTPAPEPPPPKA